MTEQTNPLALAFAIIQANGTDFEEMTLPVYMSYRLLCDNLPANDLESLIMLNAGEWFLLGEAPQCAEHIERARNLILSKAGFKETLLELTVALGYCHRDLCYTYRLIENVIEAKLGGHYERRPMIWETAEA